MIWIIAKKEFRHNILTPAFIAGMLLCLTMIPYTVYTGIKSYENRLAQYETDMKDAEDVYKKALVYSELNPLLVKPVSPLSIFSTGVSEQTGSKVTLDRKEKRVFSGDVVSLNENPFMGGVMSLDFMTAITILLSLLGILFSYDMLSREKEEGTLKLALSNPVSRSSFFLGKIVGIFLTLVPVLIVCFLVILLFIQFSPAVRFSADDYGRICLMLLLALMYFAFFVFLGGFISSRTQSSVSSIIINLFIWCFLLFLLPGAATWFGKIITPTEDYMHLQYKTQEVDNQWWNVQSKEVEEILKNENLNGGMQMINWSGDWDGNNAMMFTPRPTMEYERRKKELANPMLLGNCDKKWAIQSDYLQRVYRQEKTIRYLSCISPAGILKHISASLCRTGMDAEVNFMDQTRRFQDVFYGYFVQNKIFSSYAYISPQDESEFPADDEGAWAQYQKWDSETEREGTFDLSSFGYRDTGSFPRFAYTQPTVGNDLYEQIYLIFGIVIVCIVLFWLSFMSFIKYDVR
jgi:ABC-type transport system involved in multi-copper enzyme maturation permease subunit